MKLRRMNRSFKHRTATLRNMVCSLVKYERIETTEAKGKNLLIIMKRLFDIAHCNTKSEQEKDLFYKKFMLMPAAIKKFKENILPKLIKYRKNEVRFSRDDRNRVGDNAKMYIVELAKNKHKRNDDKKFAFFENYIDNNYFNYEVNMKIGRLNQNFNEHLMLTNLLKKIYQEIEDCCTKEKSNNDSNDNTNKYLNKIDLKNIAEKTFSKIPETLRLKSIENLILSKIFNEKISDGYSFLLHFRQSLSRLNLEINNNKNSLQQLSKIAEDKEKLNEYNKKFYKQYYPEQLKNFNEVYGKANINLQRSKQGLKNILSNLKRKEQKKKELVNKVVNLRTKNLDELNFMNDLKKNKSSKCNEEFIKTYRNNYITGEESGFSDLDDIIEKPQSLLQLREKMRDNLKRNELKGGRNVNRSVIKNVTKKIKMGKYH